MSDICDKASDSVAAVESAGGSFADPRARPEPRSLPACSCAAGARPVFRFYPVPRCSEPMETLECPACGNRVGPLSGRQPLREAWRLGGYKCE